MNAVIETGAVRTWVGAVGECSLERVAVAHRTGRGIVAGQLQRALACVDDAVGRCKRLHLRQGEGRPADDDVGDAIGRADREAAGRHMRSVVQRAARQASLIDGGVGTVERGSDHARAVRSAIDGDDQLGRRLVAVRILHRVVERVALAEPAPQRLRRRPAVVEHIAPAAVGILRQRAIGVQRRDRRRVTHAPGDKARRLVGARHVVRQHIARQAVGRRILGHGAARVIYRKGRVVDDVDYQIVAASRAAHAVHRQHDQVVKSGRRGTQMAIIVDGRGQRVTVADDARGSRVAGQSQRALAGVHHAVGRSESLHFCERECGPADDDVGDAVGCCHREAAGRDMRSVMG